MMPENAAKIYWLYGLPEAGRSELAQALRTHLLAAGHRVALLDGDELRSGLCDDLEFTITDHLENVRRGAHVAKILAAAGSIVICSFLTQRDSDREQVRLILGEQVRLTLVQCTLLGCTVCQGKEQQRSAKIANYPVAAPGDFELPTGGVISTHDRPLAASLQAMYQITATAPVQSAGGRQAGASAGGLSAREMEVLGLLSQGLRHKEMAGRLGISVTTVRTHLERACVKLSASSRTEAVARFVVLHSQAS